MTSYLFCAIGFVQPSQPQKHITTGSDTTPQVQTLQEENVLTYRATSCITAAVSDMRVV